MAEQLAAPKRASLKHTARGPQPRADRLFFCRKYRAMAAEKLEYEMAKDLEAMRAWLIERISKALRVKGSMDPDAPLSKYGLQSIDAVILAMEIEEEVGVELPPTLLWEYNTVNECAAYLMTLGPAIAA